MRSGYLKALEDTNTIEADARIENIMEFKSVIEEFEAGIEDGDTKAMIEEFEAERKALMGEGFVADEPTLLGSFLERTTLMSDIDNHNEDEDAVVLMTLHSAKGLEFPIVFIPGLENGVFPGSSATEELSKMEEERRLCYVGITRAKKKLYLTNARYRMLYGKSDFTMESIFLNEMDKDFIEGDKTDKEREKLGGGISGEGGLYGDYFYGGRKRGTADGYGGKPAGKPFDSLSASKSATKNKMFLDDDYAIGDILRHPKFGEGMLIEQDEKTMTIIFDEVGQKKIGKGYVKMEKVRKA
ncbi:MAG: ATP-binding domain-containing protein [Mogibacterium sp.]|nr:ATP-binding domain-containing protein [Mogibacterium sp.]